MTNILDTQSLGQDLASELEVQQLELELIELGDKLDPRELKALQLHLQGHPYAECVSLAGYEFKGLSDSSKIMLGVLRRAESKEYVDLVKRITTLRTLKSVMHSEQEWLSEIRTVVDTSLGRTDTKMAQFVGGSIAQGQAKKTDLNPALKALELVGRRNGWLIDRSQVEQTTSHETTVLVRDFTGASSQGDDDAE